MKFKIFLFILLLFSCHSDKKTSKLIDTDLIIPGKQAEGFLIDTTIESGSLRVYTAKNNDLSKITTISLFSGLIFDSLAFHDNSHILFIKNNTIIAIAGLVIEKKITSDAVLLSRGIDNFVFNYGNKDLVIFKIKDNTAYIYRNSGIAVFDDNSDNIIDMYIVFKVQSNSR